MSFGGSIMAGVGDDYNINVNVNLAPAQAQMAQFGQMISGMTAQASQSAAAMGAAFQTSMNTVVSQGAAAGQTMATLNTRIQTATTQTKSFGDQLGGVIARFGGITMLAQFVRQIGDSFQQAGKQMDQMGDKSLKFRQSLQDIQAMAGAPGEVSRATIESQYQLIRDVGMTPAQAHAAAEMFGGEAAIMPATGVISEATYNAIQQKAAEYAKAMGGDEKAAMVLAGKLAVRMGAAATPETVIPQMAGMFRGVGYAPGKTTQGVQGLTRILNEQVLEGGGGNIDTAMRATALYAAVMQGVPPARAPTAFGSLSSLVMGTSAGDKGFKAYMGQLGITESMDELDRLRIIIPAIQRELKMTPKEIEQASKDARAEKDTVATRRVGAVLREKGVTSAAEMRVMTSMMSHMPTVEAILEKERREPMTMPQVEAGLREYRASPAAQAARAEGAEFVAEMELGKEYEQRNIFLRKARASLIEKRKLTPETMPERALYDMMTMSGWTGAPTAEQRMLATEATRLAQVEYGEDFRLGAGGRLSQREIQQQFMAGGGAPEAFNRAAARRRRRGARAMGAIPQPIEELDMTPSGVFESTMGLRPGETPAENVGRGLGMLAHDVGAPRWVQDLLNYNRRTAEATETNARDTLPPPRAPEVPK
jgi:hypothetical protein